jgi:hypothetical protein
MSVCNMNTVFVAKVAEVVHMLVLEKEDILKRNLLNTKKIVVDNNNNNSGRRDNNNNNLIGV